MASIRNANAVRAAEGLLDWAEGLEPRCGVRYTRSGDGVIETPGGRLFRISHDGEVRVSSRSLTPHGESWNGERIKRFVQDLDEIGVRLEDNRPKAPLEAFLTKANATGLDGAGSRDRLKPSRG
jgi:hypothetical protein